MSYSHLNRSERFLLHRMRIEGYSVSAIARALQRHRSTVYRELKRNALGPASYVGAKAHTMYRDRLRWKRHRPRRDHTRLMGYVSLKLAEHWSAEQIAGRLKLDYPAAPDMRISFMTIYRFVFCNAAPGGTLWKCFRQSRKKKRKRYGSNDQRGHLQGRTLIDDRPSLVANQSRFGDWEADTMRGCTKGAYLATFVERKSLFTVVRRMKNRSAAELNRVAEVAFKTIPKALRKTLTVDNGKEFAFFSALQKALGFSIYFAHPYASWERGINENTNGLLRQYFPRKTAIENYSHQYIATAVRELNNRPRKKLNYRTPHEVFNEQCVALDM
jgi:IS30 family transposase